MSIVIRPAHPQDIDAMHAISCRVHLGESYRQLIPATAYERFRRFYTQDPTRLDRYRDKIVTRLKDAHWSVWVAEDQDRIRGFTMAVETDEAIELRGLFVDEEHQGKGIGRALFEKTVVETDKPIYLEVIEANTRAKTMYERARFKEIDARVDTFYGAPMIRMVRH